MEQTSTSTSTELTIDGSAKLYLSEGAGWAKFLAIVGFIMCALIVLLGVFAGSLLSSLGQFSSGGVTSELSSGIATVMIVVYILVAIVYFFPCLFLYRYASNMKQALASGNSQDLTTSVRNLKSMFKYVGIMTIIALAFYAIALLIGLGASSMTNFN